MKKIAGFVLALVLMWLTGCGDSGQTPQATAPKTSSDLTGRVVNVHDGDTITLETGGKRYRIRLYAIEAPELDQAYGKQSQRYLEKIILRETVNVEKIDIDQYDRILGRVFYKGRDLNLEMVREGNAWFYRGYKPTKEDGYREAERKAKSARKGFWQAADPQYPLDWKKAHNKNEQ